MDHRPVSRDSAASLQVTVNPSLQLSALLVGVHLGAFGAIIAAGLWMPWLLVAAPGLLWSLHRGLGCNGLLYLDEAVVELGESQLDGWYVVTGGGRRYTVQPCAPFYVHPGLVVVRFRCRERVPGAAAMTLVLMSDATKPDAHRRLRVRLRTETNALAGSGRSEPEAGR